jgi:Ca-activated chloride channel family protein
MHKLVLSLALVTVGCAERADLAPQPSSVSAYGVVAAPPPPAMVVAEATDAHGNTESYARVEENPFLSPKQEPLSTFSIDVDTASYSNVRRFLAERSAPPKDAVRIEELVNYFPYHYPAPTGSAPFAAHAEVASCPWDPSHRLVQIGLKGHEIAAAGRPPSNLVFLVDVSGSMFEPNKLPLLKRSMGLLVRELDERDHVSMVAYAGNTGLVLPSTSGDHKDNILAAIDHLEAGGSTNGGAGIQLAYKVATSGFIPGGSNRVILATDGDFNVGITNEGDLTRLLEDEARSKVYLTILGFGMGNMKDATMESLAKHGHGTHAYIDSLNEARKVLVEEMTGSLVTIARDVKIQVEINPARVAAYRLMGYEHRLVSAADFNNDQKDGGDIGAGLTVTALYEVVPVGVPVVLSSVDPLRYAAASTSAASGSDELLTLKIRYKQPEGDVSDKLEMAVRDSGASLDQASTDFKFAASVAGFGMLLRDSAYKGSSSYAQVEALGAQGRGADEGGYRSEFLRLVHQAARL